MKVSIALAFLMLASPLAAQEHDAHHHVATPQEVSTNKAWQGVYEQVAQRAPGSQTRAIWADLAEAMKARRAGKWAEFNRAIASARVKLAAPVAAVAPLPPEAVLLRAEGIYRETLWQSRIRLDPSPSDLRPFRKYKATTATVAALKVAAKVRAGGAATAVHILLFRIP